MNGKRITEIDGLRGFLALWVFVCHSILYANYPTKLPGPLEFWRAAWHAVDLFVIITGFSMWFLLDHTKERYLTYLGKRFFRLYPVYIVLFLIGIPVALLEFKGNELLGQPVANLQSWFSNLWKHIGLHAVMLHGVVPKTAAPPEATFAFLPPAWFVSYVWQFYLVAPLLFLFNRSHGRFIFYGLLCAATVWFRNNLPQVPVGAFLPFHIEYLFYGALSYKIVKACSEREIKIPVPLTAGAVVLSLLLFPQYKQLFLPTTIFLAKSDWWLPVSLWLIFFSMLLDVHFGKLDIVSNALSRWINSKPMQFFGRISYSFYLVHALVIVSVRTLVAMKYPELSKAGWLAVLVVLSFPASLGLSVVLHRWVEIPGAKLGKRMMGSTGSL